MTLPALESKVYLDWFKAHTRDSLRRYLASSSASASDLIEFLRPFGSAYHSSLNPVFLAECETLRQLDFAPVWLARDGLVPLLWFFSRFPTPGGFKGRIYLPAEFAELAPEAWRKRIGTYRYGALPRSKVPKGFVEHRVPVTRLVLLGISSPAYCGLERLEELLRQARKQFKTRFGSFPKEVQVCLIQKTEPLGTVEQASQHANEVMLRICREFGAKVRIMSLQAFELGLSFNGTAICELNDRLLCADTALIHAAVGRGATLIDAPLSAAGAKYERMTLTHGFELQDALKRPDRASLLALESRLEDAMISTANKNFPWRVWAERDSEKEQIHESLVTGFPRRIETGSRSFSVVLPSAERSLDVVYLGVDKLDIHGWCADRINGRAPVELHVLRNSKRLPGTTTFTVRADVQHDLGRKFDENFRPGFEFQLPRSALKDIRRNETFSIYCLFGHELAMQIGQFRLDPKTSQVTILPVRNKAMGSYLPARIGKDKIEVFPAGKDKRAISYALGETEGHYQARFDLCENEEGELVLTGWAADFLRGAPAEAILVHGGDEQALVFPVLERRPDIAKTLDRAENSGFKLRAPWVRPRVFVLFEPGVAIEMALPGTSGSA